MQAGYDPFLGIVAAVVTGVFLGLLVGSLVVYANLSSLIATLGMNFMLRGLILIITQVEVDRAGDAQRQLGLQDLLQHRVRGSGADLLGDRSS